MKTIPLDIVSLKELNVQNAFMSKEQVKEFLKYKTNAYYNLKKEFEALIKEGVYPEVCYISLGNVELFNIYAFLHFLTYRENYKDRYLKTTVPKFDAVKYKKLYQDIGVV